MFALVPHYCSYFSDNKISSDCRKYRYVRIKQPFHIATFGGRTFRAVKTFTTFLPSLPNKVTVLFFILNELKRINIVGKKLYWLKTEYSEINVQMLLFIVVHALSYT